MPRKDSFLIQAFNYLSQKVAEIEPFYNLTACLNPEERELIGFCKAYSIMFPEDKDFNMFLEEKITPMLKAIGISKWPRGEITDLGLRLGRGDREDVYLIPEDREESEEVRR